jgi:hypothetical protein
MNPCLKGLDMHRRRKITLPESTARLPSFSKENLGGGSGFPDGDPVTIYVGQDPGGSTDLIARALADTVSDDLGVAVTVENKPGANGALAAKELAGRESNGHTLMIYNGSLAYLTPLALPEGEALDIAACPPRLAPEEGARRVSVTGAA